MKVITTHLESFAPPDAPPRPLPEGVRVERATAVPPEYARFLYALVGGPWHWTDLLDWTRERWAAELAQHGVEFWIAYGGGLPLGYVQLHPVVVEDRTHVEIRYFGLVESAIGHGLGGALLERGIAAAWTLAERTPVPPTVRVWVHTCSLDGPAALANYRARGLEVFRVEETEDDVPDAPLGSWVATGGRG